MTIGIIVNKTRDVGFTLARRLAGAIRARGGKVVLTTGVDTGLSGCPQDLLPLFVDDRRALSECDVLICIGGDGTLIKTARETYFSGKPLLGVNSGSLGYLTEVESPQLEAVLDRLFSHDYRIEERMMLAVTRVKWATRTDSGAGDAGSRVAAHEGGGDAPDGRGNPDAADAPDGRGSPDIADAQGGADEIVLNELAIVRGDAPHVVKMKVYVNGALLDVYPGDGILVSTPTGSTAYSLSAGGPVIDPELAAISIVPICPHVIFSRPVIISPDKEITIVSAGADGTFPATVSADGFRGPDLYAGDVIKIRRSEHATRILRFYDDNFYTVLKSKLYNTANRFG